MMKTHRILLFIPNGSNLRLLEDCLSQEHKIIAVEDDALLDGRFDMGILDASLLTNLEEKIQKLRKRRSPVFLPFLVLVPRAQARNAVRFLGETVDDLILTPLEPALLKARISNLLRLRMLSIEARNRFEEAKKLSITDDVSGFFNTRFLHQFLDKLLIRPEPLVSLVFSDMDKFKSVVDTHGHLLGAKVLREAAEVFDQYLEPHDRIVRYGGDEYVMILPGQGKAEAMRKIEALRQGLVDATFLREENIDLRITASFGLATYPDDAGSKRDLLAAADRCLFRSKKLGRNRVTVEGAEI